MDLEAKLEDRAAAKKQMLITLFLLVVAIVGVVCLALFTEGDGICLQAKSVDDCTTVRVYQAKNDEKKVDEAILECCELWEKEMCQENGKEIPIDTNDELTEQYDCTLDEDTMECSWGECDW